MNQTTRWTVLWTDKPKNKKPKWFDGELHVRKCGKRAVLLDDNDDVVTNVHFRAKDKLKAGEVINTGVYGVQIDAQLKGNQYWESVKRTNPLFSQLYEGDEPRRVTEPETNNEPVAHTLNDDLRPHSSTQFITPAAAHTQVAVQPAWMTQPSEKGYKSSCKLIKAVETHRYEPYPTKSATQDTMKPVSEMSFNFGDPLLPNVKSELPDDDDDQLVDLNATVHESQVEPEMAEISIPDISSQLSQASVKSDNSLVSSQELKKWLKESQDDVDLDSLPLFEDFK